MRFERLSIEQGLSQSVVNCILQDSTGFLWLGTQAGLNRYDGYGFEVYRHDPEDPASLPHDWIQALVEDPSGDLWVGTEGGGLARWQRATDSFVSYRHDPADPRSLAGDRVVDFAWDRAGGPTSRGLWIATFDTGLERFDLATGTFLHFRHDPADPRSLADDRVRAVYEDGRGRLWVGTLGGLDLVDPLPAPAHPERTESRSFVHYRHHPGDPRSLSDDRVRQLLEDRHGDLWVGTHGGLNRLDRRSATFTRYLHDPADSTSLSHDWVRSLHEDRDGRLWVGTDGGLNLWREESGTFVAHHPDPADPASLGSDQVLALYQDRGDVLWISTVGAGLSKWNPGTWSFPHYWSDEGGASNMVFSISEDRRGGLWIGTFGGGLERIERAAEGHGAPASRRTRFTHDPANPRSLSDDRVTALLHDRQGNLWAGTLSAGLERFADGRFEHHRHDPARPDSLSANAVTALYEDRRDRLWVGTHGGGLNLHLGGDAWSRFRHHPVASTSLSNDRVLSLAEGPAGHLWLATGGGGLNRLHPATGAFLRLRHDPAVPDSLASDDTNAVHVDANRRLWVGTRARGLDRLDRLDERTGRGVFRNFSRHEGLPDDTIWGIRSDAAGDLWLATNKGLARFDPATETVTSYSTSHGLQSDEFNMGAHFQSPSGELFFGGLNGFNAFFPDRIEPNSHVPNVVVTAFTKLNRPVPFGRPVFDVEAIALGYRDYYFSVELAALDFTAPEENRYRYKLEGFDADWVDLGHRRRVTFTNLDAGRYTLRLQGSNNDGVWNEAGATVAITVAPSPWQSWWAWTLYVLGLGLVVTGFVRRQQGKVDLERANAERERANAERERLNAERERQSAEERRHLLAERETLIGELEHKNAELERFNYTVSHDLKTPLVTIKNFLGLLLKDARSGDVKRLDHDARRIGAAADRLSRLLDELLELSRLGRHAGPPEEVPLAELAREALEKVREPAIERGVAVKIEPRLPVVFGDRLRLLQLLHNLLANAVQYMGDESAPRIEVGLRHDVSEDERSGRDALGRPQRVFFVRDNGMGIDRRYHELVFGLFERLDAAAEGTGIGLALAKRIVEMHGGRIWVESEGLGRGSTFCFTLAEQRALDGGVPRQERGKLVEAGDRFR